MLADIVSSTNTPLELVQKVETASNLLSGVSFRLVQPVVDHNKNNSKDGLHPIVL